VRVPVEATLFYLLTYKAIPQIMTFEGRNFDILSGLTAPVVYYLAFVQGKMGRKGLLIWNVVCLALVINIVSIGLLSAPLPIQQFGFEQPNIGVLYFPFNLLPSFVVPAVIFAHLAEIRRLLRVK
jgi:cytochrome c biogenesis factor